MHDVYCEANAQLCVLHVINNYCSGLSVVQMHEYYEIIIIIQTGAHLHHRCVPTEPIPVQITLGYTRTQALYTHA